MNHIFVRDKSEIWRQIFWNFQMIERMKLLAKNSIFY